MMKNTASSSPWYREPWPWILMAGPLIVVIAGFITAWLAFSSSDGLVEDDYYKKGLAIDQLMARDQEAAVLGLSADLMRGADGELRLILAAGRDDAKPAEIVVRFVHPTRAGNDQNVVLKQSAGGFYSGRLATPISGRWNVLVEDSQRRWRLAGAWDADAQPTLALRAAKQ